MNHLNSIVIEGNLAEHPTLKYTHKGVPVCEFKIITTRYYTGEGGVVKEEVSFFDVEVWRKLADYVCGLGHKDRGVRVVGRIRQDRWIGANGERSKVVIVGEHVEFKPKLFDKKDEATSDEGLQDDGVTGGDAPAVSF
jgi:single-strand DNA-binding protein